MTTTTTTRNEGNDENLMCGSCRCHLADISNGPTALKTIQYNQLNKLVAEAINMAHQTASVHSTYTIVAGIHYYCI